MDDPRNAERQQFILGCDKMIELLEAPQPAEQWPLKIQWVEPNPNVIAKRLGYAHGPIEHEEIHRGEEPAGHKLNPGIKMIVVARLFHPDGTEDDVYTVDIARDGRGAPRRSF
jgi:hypothetical protein